MKRKSFVHEATPAMHIRFDDDGIEDLTRSSPLPAKKKRSRVRVLADDSEPAPPGTPKYNTTVNPNSATTTRELKSYLAGRSTAPKAYIDTPSQLKERAFVATREVPDVEAESGDVMIHGEIAALKNARSNIDASNVVDTKVSMDLVIKEIRALERANALTMQKQNAKIDRLRLQRNEALQLSRDLYQGTAYSIRSLASKVSIACTQAEAIDYQRKAAQSAIPHTRKETSGVVMANNTFQHFVGALQNIEGLTSRHQATLEAALGLGHDESLEQVPILTELENRLETFAIKAGYRTASRDDNARLGELSVSLANLSDSGSESDEMPLADILRRLVMGSDDTNIRSVKKRRPLTEEQKQRYATRRKNNAKKSDVENRMQGPMVETRIIPPARKFVAKSDNLMAGVMGAAQSPANSLWAAIEEGFEI